MSRTRTIALAAIALIGASAHPAYSDTAGCQRSIVKLLLKFEKVLVRAHTKCLDLENLGRIPGPCPDAAAELRMDTVAQKVVTNIAAACTAGDLTALGFPSDCNYGGASGAAVAACAALPTGTVAEAAACLECWKAAELVAFAGTLYASHAIEICDGALDGTSPTCVPLGCTTPLPDQRNLTDDSSITCQRGVGKGGLVYLLKRVKVLAACGLAGGTRASCLADPVVQDLLAAAEQRKDSVITRKCGNNRDPEPSPVFCCRTTGNQCIAAATREDCTMAGGSVQEDKFCDVDNTCATVAGAKEFTWWGTCPAEAVCPGPALEDTDALVGCVDDVADRVADRLLCLQLRGNGGADWPCPS